METAAAATIPQSISRTSLLSVKWGTPVEEIDGVVALAHAMVERRQASPQHICLAVPNRNWALQVQHACQQAELRESVCIPPAHLSAGAQTVLAKLRAIASPHDRCAHELLAQQGYDEEAADTLVRTCRDARGRTLIHALRLNEHPELQTALLHLCGDETPERMLDVINEQLSHPTPAASTASVAIMHYQHISGTFDHIILIGCVNGLVPGPRAFGDDERICAQAREEARSALTAAITAARVRTVISTFSKIDATLARAAHVRFTRCKTEHGRLLALAQPTLFLEEQGSARPVTYGGQAFLREYGLN